ncbi:zinc-finger domain-containing protein [Candidatus Paracaedibacter symbiosus]|uniref:zinc-finger domain-containing protein n=1 Tax=Candidatus Paracaedibacter symbiosus TaxID=244582 RepID=UPI00094F2B1F|nr:zinc-finger domain-containing protein [Candidatus Paracaedibacter symbiosus]
MTQEIRYVDETIVNCDGNGNSLSGGHPLVYLNLGQAGETECPYCSRVFILNK